MTETPTTVNPLGVKGIGETGTIASTPAVYNAVMDALRPARRHEDRHAAHPRAGLARDPAGEEELTPCTQRASTTTGPGRWRRRPTS